MIKTLAIVAAVAVSAAGAAFAQQTTTGATTGAAPATRTEALSSLPTNAMTVTNYYKQNVYDPSDSKIGEISDVLVNKEGRIDAFIVSVGGFLGIGEKDVAVPFNAVSATQKDGKWYLTMSATKDQLKNANGYKYDSAKATWVPA